MQRIPWAMAVTALAVSCSLSNADVPQCIVPESVEFVADDASQNTDFGTSVDVDGDLAVVGAPGNNNGGTRSGAAYVFQKTGTQWQQVAKLTPNDPTTNQDFGASVAIDGNTVVVASRFPVPSESSHCAVYVFRNVGGAWQQIAKLANSLGSGDETRDMNVAVHGDLVAIGCPYAATRGAVFLFREIGDSWLPIAFPPPLSTEGIFFYGTSIALGDGRLVVGAPYAAAGGIQSGAAYVYNQRSNGSWGAPTRLTPDDPTSGAQFGTSVALDGETIVVGATRATSPMSTYGAAYVFERVSGPWDQTAKLSAPEDLLAFEVGTRVSIRGEIIAVSASSTGPQTTGAALIFRLESDWSYIGTLTPSDGVEWDDFGSAIALDGTTLLAGAAGGGINTSYSGSAYAYDLFPFSQDCNANGVPDPCDLATGASTDCNGNGIPDECDIASQISGDCNHDAIPDECRNVPIPEVTSFAPSDLLSNQRFGRSVDLSGDTAVIGAPGINSGIAGSAYIYRNNGVTWEQIAQLVPNDSAAADRFGYSVAIDGTTAVIGAYGNDDAGDNSGVAYIFEESPAGWIQTARLTRTDAGAYDDFGISVTIHGGTAVIGAPGDNGFGNGSGAAYVFEEINGLWQQTATLVADDADTGPRLGWSIDFDGNFVIVGAFLDNDRGSESGSAYVFRKIGGTWQQVAKLSAQDATAYDHFGGSVSVDGHNAVIGAVHQHYQPSDRYGAAYVFEEFGGYWRQAEKLTATDPAAEIRYGKTVRMNGDTVVVGTADESIGSSGAINGPVYVYRETGGDWREFVQLGPSNGSTENDFGGGIAVEGATVLIGAALEPSDAPTGAVYAYDLSPLDLRGDLNEDGNVDTDDLAILVNVMLDFDTDPLHVARADVNCSGDVDGRDLQAFVTRLLSEH